MVAQALVTGCAGFIGSHLTESLLEDGVSVLGVDCFNNNYGRDQKLRNLEAARGWDAFEFLPIDLSRGELDDVVEESDVIFHLAAEPGVRPSWGQGFESYLRNNVAATQHLLEACKRWPDKRLVYASSSSIYGQAERLPTPESVTPAPFSPYGMTKLSGEHLCSLYRGNFGVPTVALRFFTVYGPRQRPDMAFNIFCRSVLAGSPVQIFGDGRQTRDFTYVADVVSALRAAATTDAAVGETFNVGGGSRVSLTEALDLLAELSGRSIDVRRLAVQQGDVRDTGADISAARRVLGYEPRVDFRSGMAEEWAWVTQNAQRLPA